MKILHTVQSYLPARHGMQEVATQLSERLVSLGHEVTVATSWDVNRKESIINGVNIKSFKIDGNLVTGITGETKSYQEFLKTNHFDIVTNFQAQQWATDLTLPLLTEIPGKKVFVPTGFSALSFPAYSGYFEQMKEWMKLYDMNVFLAERYRDIDFAKANGVKSYTIIPNGANQVEFDDTAFIDIRKSIGVSQDTQIVLHVSNHTGFKGHKEAIQIFKAAKLKNAILLLVGNPIRNGKPFINLAKEIINLCGLKKTNCCLQCKILAAEANLFHREKAIFVKTFDRPTTVNSFKQSDVFLFPSLIECSPIVLFETLAASTPFLSGDVGNAREITKWTNGGKLLPTHIDSNGYSRVNINESAEILRQLIQNRKELNELGTKGRQSVIDNFSWTKITEKYENLYYELLEK